MLYRQIFGITLVNNLFEKAFCLFLWVTGRFGSRLERTIVVFALLGTLVALVATFTAVILSTS